MAPMKFSRNISKLLALYKGLCRTRMSLTQVRREKSEWNIKWTDLRILCYCLQTGKKGTQWDSHSARQGRANKVSTVTFRYSSSSVCYRELPIKNIPSESAADCRGQETPYMFIIPPNPDTKPPEHLLMKSKIRPQGETQWGNYT